MPGSPLRCAKTLISPCCGASSQDCHKEVLRRRRGSRRRTLRLAAGENSVAINNPSLRGGGRGAPKTQSPSQSRALSSIHENLCQAKDFQADFHDITHSHRGKEEPREASLAVAKCFSSQPEIMLQCTLLGCGNICGCFRPRSRAVRSFHASSRKAFLNVHSTLENP